MNRYGERSYALKVSMVKTPPMIPESIPNSIPPKQACLCQHSLVSPSRTFRAHRACQSVHAPSIDLWGILLDSIVVDDLVEETHVVDYSFCRTQAWESSSLSGGGELISRMRTCCAFKLPLHREWRSRPHRDQGRYSWNNGFSPSW
jgi:hypothetical protein